MSMLMLDKSNLRGRWKSSVMQRVYAKLLGKKKHHMDALARPTEVQRNQVLTGFVLGAFSIFTAFFPLCGLPIALTGLFMGLSCRRITALRTMVLWGICLSVVGLVLTLISVMVVVRTYLSFYL